MTRLSRAAASLALICLFATAAAPAAATPLAEGFVTPSPGPSAPLTPGDGELLTSDADGCGTLTVSPSNPLFGDSVTVSLSGSPITEGDVSVAIVPGLLIGDRWFALSFIGDGIGSDDPDDGIISTIDTSLGELIVETDAEGDGSRTFFYPQFDTLNFGDAPLEALIIFAGIFPSAWVALCDETDTVSSRADVRPGRERLDATLAFDADTAGALIGSGFDGVEQLIPLLAPLQAGLSPADSLWLGLLGESEGIVEDALVELDIDPETGEATGVHGFGDLPPGQYALGAVAFVGELPFGEALTSATLSDALRGEFGSSLDAVADHSQPVPFTIPKAEWVLTVAADGVLTLEKADGTQQSPDPELALADTGPDELILPFALSIVIVLMGVTLFASVRRRTTAG